MFLHVDNLKIKDKKGRIIVQDISFDVKKGDIFVIVGRNGAGKSTVVKYIMGVPNDRLIPQGGIIFLGKDITDLSLTERARLGMSISFQRNSFLEGIMIYDYLKLAINYREKFGTLARSKKDVKTDTHSDDIIKDVLNKVDLAPQIYLYRNLDKSLSGGERRRLEMAFFLIAVPRLLILDEPDTGIDMFSIDKIKDAILSLKSRGSTIIIVTHDISILDISDTGILLGNKTIILRDNISAIKDYIKKNCFNCPYFK